ncbi:GRAS family protein [Streptomyces sp. NPDC056773]|uniref:GRAS family protein n=1 Tax=unclassified Streptomyces TaxID=2593676 RepID=UPI00367CD2B8
MNEVHDLFVQAAEAAQADDHEVLAAVLKRAAVLPTSDTQLRDYYLAGFGALSHRRVHENLYLSAEDIAQIDLFSVLHRHLPLLRAAQLANDSLLPFLPEAEHATVLALGIGQGAQECDLLGRAPHLRSLTVIAVDIAADSLAVARAALQKTAERTATILDYRPVHRATEDLGPETWREVRSTPRPLLVISSFALHHMRDRGGEDTRTALFRQLHDLKPAAVAICEPDSDHHRVALPARFANSWKHYTTLFRAIDSTGATDSEKAAMKHFFGREIENIIGAVDAERFERHEPAQTWAARLNETGFRLRTHQTPGQETRPGFSAISTPTHIELAYASTPLAAVLTATPA